MKPHRGVLILVFGILGLTVCGIFGPVAWIMGNADMKEIRAGRMDPSGEQMTNIGRILGMVGSILILVSMCFAVLWVLLIAGTGFVQ
ncbi:MAG: DUF4190 domain-containing protein [Planctomycetes bacterium]|nr:DUF4190 domain-containing protein [Planctomycetota bacterium]